jgi:hypothetical protein
MTRGRAETGGKVVQLAASPRAYEPQSAEEIARDRAAFHLRLKGLSVEACAERLNCAVDDVLVSLSRMCCMPVEQLRKQLIRCNHRIDHSKSLISLTYY